MMLGMEGGADLNADKKITARELYQYVLDKVEDNHSLDKLQNYKEIKTECL